MLGATVGAALGANEGATVGTTEGAEGAILGVVVGLILRETATVMGWAQQKAHERGQHLVRPMVQ